MSATVVQIVCTAESHAPRVSKLATFEIVTRGIRLRRKHAGLMNRPGDGVGNVVDPDAALPSLIGDTPQYLLPAGHSRQGSRIRYSQSCKLCGATLTARWERLEPIILQLAAHGVSRVSIDALAAILR